MVGKKERRTMREWRNEERKVEQEIKRVFSEE